MQAESLPSFGSGLDSSSAFTDSSSAFTWISNPSKRRATRRPLTFNEGVEQWSNQTADLAFAHLPETACRHALQHSSVQH